MSLVHPSYCSVEHKSVCFKKVFIYPYTFSEAYSSTTRIGRLHLGQFWPVICFCKEGFIGTQPYSSNYVLSVAAFAQQLWNWVIAKEILWPEKPTVYTICPFTEKKNVCQPWTRTVFSNFPLFTLLKIIEDTNVLLFICYVYLYSHIRNQIWK